MLFRTPEKTLDAGPAPERRRQVSEVLQEAVKGSDAYLFVRRAVKREEGVLRVGNLFLREEELREIAFIAVGDAAAPMAQGLHDALGEALTQGFVAGPMPPPGTWPFRYFPVVEPTFPSPEGVAVADHALELAHELGEKDLLIPLLSSGALGMLSAPPPGLPREEYASLLGRVAEAPAAETLLPTVAGMFGRAQGGRLSEAAGSARVEALLIDEGRGGELLGGGPTVPVLPERRRAALAALREMGVPSLPTPLLRSVEAAPSAPSERHHSVVVGGVADALEAAGSEAADHKHRPRLLELHDPSPPGELARQLGRTVEEMWARLPSREGEGIALFLGASFGRPEGAVTSRDLAEFLSAARQALLHRRVEVGALVTCGSIRASLEPSGGLIDAETPFDPSAFLAGGSGALDLRPGFSAVGAVVTAYLTH